MRNIYVISVLTLIFSLPLSAQVHSLKNIENDINAGNLKRAKQDLEAYYSDINTIKNHYYYFLNGLVFLRLSEQENESPTSRKIEFEKKAVINFQNISSDHKNESDYYVRSKEILNKMAISINKRAETLSEIGKHKEAMKEYDRAYVTSPSYVYCEKAAKSALNASLYVDATTFYILLTTMEYPDKNEAYLMISRIYNEVKNDYQSALYWSSQGLKQFPDDLALINQQIDLMFKTKELEGIEDVLAKGIELDPDNPGYYYNLGSVYYNRASENIKKIQDLVTGSTEYNELADQILRELNLALPNLKKTTELSPQNSNAWLALSYVYFYLEMPDESIAAEEKYNSMVGN